MMSTIPSLGNAPVPESISDTLSNIADTLSDIPVSLGETAVSIPSNYGIENEICKLRNILDEQFSLMNDTLGVMSELLDSIVILMLEKRGDTDA